MPLLNYVWPVVLGVAAIASAVAAERTVVAESRQVAPLALDGTTITVVLVPLGSYDDILKADRPDRQFYVTIDSLRAEGGVEATFEVYLDLPAGVPPRRDDPHYIGDFNFFGAEGRSTAASFNVSRHIGDLRGRAARGEAPAVTIVPNGTVTSRPSIGRLSLAAVTP